MILCIEQSGTSHVVYEIEEPAWGGIGALTTVDREHAHAYANKLVEQGLMTPGPFNIALYGNRPDPLDQLPTEVRTSRPAPAPAAAAL
jgi:hypothetical protein